MFSFGEKHGWLNKEVRENLKGGLTMIFKRVAQTFSEPGIDSTAWTVPNGNPGRILLFQDVNSLYPTTMRQSQWFIPEIRKKSVLSVKNFIMTGQMRQKTLLSG